MIRPETTAALYRWREVIAASAIAIAGLYVASLGGLFFVPLGLAVIALAISLGVQAFRRLRFVRDSAAPGMIEVDEAQIAYLSHLGGGYISLTELAEIRLVTRRGHRYWHLRQTDGDTLPIPVDATGSEALFDAFATLPGMDTGALVTALSPQATPAGSLPALDSLSRVIWQRPGKGIAPR